MNTKILFQSPYKFTDYQLHAGVNASIQKEGFLGRFIFRLASTAVSNAVAGMALTVHKLCLIGAVAAAAIGLVAQNTALTDHALDHAQTLGFLILADMTEVLKTTIQLAFKVLAFVGAFLEPFV
ncbi:MAG: hypothetical protein ACOYK9_02495, partial [Chlamydiia bacterium]